MGQSVAAVWHSVVEPTGRPAGERAAVGDQPRPLDRDRRARAVGGGRLEVDADVELLAGELEGEERGPVGRR